MSQKEKKVSFWDKEISHREKLIWLGTLIGAGIGTVSGIFALTNFLSSSSNSLEKINERMIMAGLATEEDLEQYKRIDKQVRKNFKDIINPKLISKYGEGEFEHIFSLKDIHQVREIGLHEHGYVVPVQIRLYDKTVRPNKTLGISIVLSYNKKEELYFAEFNAFPGGSFIIDEVASLGVKKDSSSFPANFGNFDFIPEERKKEAASVIYRLPNNVIWSYEFSAKNKEETQLKGEALLPGGRVEISFDKTDGLPKLSAPSF